MCEVYRKHQSTFVSLARKEHNVLGSVWSTLGANSSRSHTTQITQKRHTTYHLFVRFHLEVTAFVHHSNALSPVNQGITLFFNMLNSAPPLDRHYESGK